MQKAIVQTVRTVSSSSPLPATIWTHHDFLKGLLGADMATILENSGTRFKPKEWENFEPLDLRGTVVADNAQRQEPGWLAFYGKIDQWLLDQEATRLQEALFEEDALLSLLQQRVMDVGLTLIPDRLKTAISAHFSALLNQTHTSTADMNVAWRAMPMNSRTGLAQDALDLLAPIAVQANSMKAVMTSYSELTDSLPLTKRPDITARKIVLPLIAAGLDDFEPAIAYLERRSSELIQALMQVDAAQLGEIREHLGEPHEGDEPTGARWRIYSALGLQPTQSDAGAEGNIKST